MTSVVSVRFRSGTKDYYFDPGELVISAGEDVIVDTAQGDACQLPVQAPGDAEGDGCLADAGGAHQAKDLRRRIRRQLPHCQGF